MTNESVNEWDVMGQELLCPICNGTLKLATIFARSTLVCQTNKTHKFINWSKKRGAY